MNNRVILALFILLAGVSASPQSLTLSDSQGPILNNGTVTPHGTSTSDELVAYAYVTNTSSATIQVRVKKVETYLTGGTTNTFCWGLCYPPNVYVSSDAIAIGPGETNYIDFSGHLAPNGISGYDLIRYVFYDESNTSDSVCMNVNYVHYAVGMEPATASIAGCYPNPADRVLWLRYSMTGVGTLSVYSVAGREMLRKRLDPSAEMVLVNTSDLPDGIYFCRLEAGQGGTLPEVRKFMVLHISN